MRLCVCVCVRSALMEVFSALCLFFHLFAAVQASSDHHTYSISAPHRFYECPEGANVTLQCAQSGSKANQGDMLRRIWLFTSRSNEHCHKGVHPRGVNNNNRSVGVEYTETEQIFSVTLRNIKHRDQGKYCCLSVEVQKNHKPDQEAHSYIFLTVMSNHSGSLKCSEWAHNPSDDSVAEGLAIAACVAFILCLPLILMLVYRQRQTEERSRRAHELVRMDSEAHGHENPVFSGDSPQPKTRTPSQIMRQSSETGRHLLTDPGTPFSPNIHGDVFFSTQESIPESPNLME